MLLEDAILQTFRILKAASPRASPEDRGLPPKNPVLSVDGLLDHIIRRCLTELES